MPDEAKSFKYDVFISYSRSNEEFASRLEQALESYKPEKSLNVPQRHINAFRDREDFAAGDYHQILSKNLNESSKLLIICSPEARQSGYIDDEIKRFVDIRGPEHIIPILYSGIPNNEAKPEQKAEMAFPKELCKAMKMPLALNYLNFDTGRDKIDKGILAG